MYCLPEQLVQSIKKIPWIRKVSKNRRNDKIHWILNVSSSVSMLHTLHVHCKYCLQEQPIQSIQKMIIIIIQIYQNKLKHWCCNIPNKFTKYDLSLKTSSTKNALLGCKLHQIMIFSHLTTLKISDFNSDLDSRNHLWHCTLYTANAISGEETQRYVT